MKDTNHLYCRILLDVFEAKGIRDIIASPGTRNAPLLVSCSYRENFRTQIVSDERNAAFIAMGISMSTRRPVVVLCTSGTALYNYAPAVAEAFYQGLPLIILSADRPFQWIDQLDSQTLIQPGALKQIVKKSFDIPVQQNDSEIEWYVNRVANEAVNESISGKPGPIHINIQFDAPLGESIEIENVSPRTVNLISSKPSLPPDIFKELTEKLLGKKILIVAGNLTPDKKINHYLSLFSSLPGVNIMCETISNLHLKDNPFAVDTILAGLSDNEKKMLAPDIVISIGGALISGMLKDFVRNYAGEVWTLGDTYHGIDVFKKLTFNIGVDPDFFFRAFYFSLKKEYGKNKDKEKIPVSYNRIWKDIKSAQLKARDEFVEQTHWSELKAFRYIFNNIPRQFNLFLSNGTTVRYAQLFTSNIPHASYANRGVSGIDGTSATALGCALGYNGPTILITGDMSFGYATSILGYEFRPSSFKIIVINNKGGGIFRFISPTRYIEHRDKFLCADPKIPVESLARAYGWMYYKVSSEEDIKREFQVFLYHKGNALLEVFSDEEYSAGILRKYMRINALKQ